MRRITPLIIFLFVISVFLVSGCMTVRPVTHERVDQNLSGNQGYLMGEGTTEKDPNRKDTKTYIKFDIDLSGSDAEEEIDYEQSSRTQSTDDFKKMASDKPGDYNKGYFVASDIDETKKKSDLQCAIIEEPIEVQRVEIETYQEPVYDYYTVKKGETLWDIAGRPEVYGNSSKWKVIFNANKDKIKKPSLIKPGMKLKIPR
jgi:nucleoid-associated protein YgaU